MRVGDKVEIGLVREGKPVRVTAIIADTSTPQAAGTPEPIHPAFEGATLVDAPDSGGALVRSVEPGSAAAQVGLRNNDVIVGANRGRVSSIQQLRDRAKGTGVLVLEVRRGNSVVLIPLH
jgi:S1-C subfamily serine protease